MKKYQPERTDLLINTDWGIPRDGMTEEEARSKKMRLFHNRWVTNEEKKQLKDERNAYAAIRVIGFALLFICVLVLINIRLIAADGITTVVVAVLYAFAATVTGSGVIRYALWARYPAILIFLSFFILPFMPLFESEKGAPLLFILGMAGLYYFLRKTARKIFWPQAGVKSDNRKIRPLVRKTAYAMALLISLSAGYFVYEMSQAKRMAADACGMARAGMPVEEYLSKLSGEDYKIIRGSETITIVPKRGLGRNNCTLTHDGRNMTGAKTGFID
ncbi:MAG: hypothetical protein CVU71_03555 [Deltaproteobacteria bacterium HGW-Deltaproteobacteria-6]|jgi:hypothetical protein|nr:MAG: hypothetical protein CVU71_03555 [Deltaproteobacteria bacterium HGW-Deltaproteobacteria-6]